jgi:MinD-like ATPase involved in chromosome partitioning or flagellar assembly
VKKHLFLLIDEDELFVESVIAFLAVSGYAAIVELKVFTSLEAAERMLEKSEVNALAIVTESIIREKPGLEHVRRLAVLVDDIPVGVPRNSEYNSGEPIRLHKFQSLHRLFEQLCRYDEVWINADRMPNDNSLKQTQVIAVYAAAGGAGKTTVALNMARLFTRRQKTLYLTLESLSAAQSLLSRQSCIHEDGRFSKLIYYLKSDPGKLQNRWDLFIDTEAATGLHYIAPVHAAKEMEAMSGETARQLIDVLAGTNRYERLVIDLDSTLNHRTAGVLERSDDVIWLIQGDALSLCKTRSARGQLPALRNVHWVANKHTGHPFPKDTEEGIEPTYFLPYIPEWKTVAEPHALLSHRLFTEAVGAMIASVFEHARPAWSGIV